MQKIPSHKNTKTFLLVACWFLAIACNGQQHRDTCCRCTTIPAKTTKKKTPPATDSIFKNHDGAIRKKIMQAWRY